MRRSPKSGPSLAVLSLGWGIGEHSLLLDLFPILVPPLSFLKPNKTISLAENKLTCPVIIITQSKSKCLAGLRYQAMPIVKNCKTKIEPCNFQQVFLPLQPRLMGKHVCPAVAKMKQNSASVVFKLEIMAHQWVMKSA